jgi:hypothetical protein
MSGISVSCLEVFNGLTAKLKIANARVTAEMNWAVRATLKTTCYHTITIVLMILSFCSKLKEG